MIHLFILPPSFVLLFIKAGYLSPAGRTMSHWWKGESSNSPAPRQGTLPSALPAPSPWFYALWLESGECLFSLDPKTGSSSYIADCSSRLANDLVLKMYLPVSLRGTILPSISSQFFYFPAGFYCCVAMKSQVILILLCICDNSALRNILET